MKSVERHWGQWVKARAAYVGHIRQQELAADIGCTPQHLAAWYRSANPPKNMRKGFDHKLAWALKTSPEMLFTGWAETPPENAREYIFPRNSPVDSGFFERATNRQLFEEFFDGYVLPNLTDEEVDEVVCFALLKAARKSPGLMGTMVRGVKHPALDRLKLFCAKASEPGEIWEATSEQERNERPPSVEKIREAMHSTSPLPPAPPPVSPPPTPAPARPQVRERPVKVRKRRALDQ